MARSSYIYVDLEADQLMAWPIASFTVKYECAHWLKGMDFPFIVLRYRDGGEGIRENITEDFLSED